MHVNVYLHPTTSLRITLDTFHLPETVQDRFLWSSTTITRSSIYPDRTKTNHHKLIINQRSPPPRTLPPLEPPLVYTYAVASSLTSISPETQRVTHLLVRRGKQVWPIVRKLSTKAGWWDSIYLVEAIRGQFSYYLWNLVTFAIWLILLQFS